MLYTGTCDWNFGLVIVFCTFAESDLCPFLITFYAEMLTCCVM